MEDVADVSIRKARENLCKWDDLTHPFAPISEENQETVVELLSAVTSRPFSEELINQSRSTYQDLNADKSTNEECGPPSTSIDEFLNWYDETEEKHRHKISHELSLPVVVDRDSSSRGGGGGSNVLVDYIGQLNGHKTECQALLQQLDGALHHLNELHSQYTSVSTRTTALHTDCEHLLAEQTALTNNAEEIHAKLWYFTQVDSISQKLTSPAFSVTSEGFIPLLAKIDQCIAYMKNNHNYRESSVYLVRYMHCLSRALSLIRMYVTRSLEASAKQVLPKPGEMQPNSDNASVLYYSKFRTNAPRIKSLMQEIEERLVDEKTSESSDRGSERWHSTSSEHNYPIETNEGPALGAHSLAVLYQQHQGDASHQVEYRNLLNDCHQCYFQQRQLLLGPSVVDAVSQLVNTYRRDHCTLVRSGCAFLVHVCEDEYALYQQFFSLPTPELDTFLEGLCIALYDGLRPLIIHIDHLETLSELCSILRRGMIEEHLQSNPRQLSALRSVVNRMLEDAQERLVYRAHVYISSDIAGFVASPGDLAYPSKLELMEQIAKEIAENTRRASRVHARTSSDTASVASMGSESGMSMCGERFSRVGSSPADLHGMWYPTLRRTLMCLSKLYRCVDKSIFQGVSLEAVAACVQSLNDAATAISTKSSATHAALFQIKHLLILREQLAPFQVDSSVKETIVDWSKLKDAAYGLVQQRNNLFSLSSNNALLQFIVDGVPQVTEQLMDSKKDVDFELKRVCERLIHANTEVLVGPLTSLITKVDVILAMNKNEAGVKPVLIKNQPFASPAKIGEVVSEVCRNIRSKLPKLQRSLHLYLANRDTEFILLKPVRINVASSFVRMNRILSENYSPDDVLIANCPSVDEVNMMMNALLEVKEEGTANESIPVASDNFVASSAAVRSNTAESSNAPAPPAAGSYTANISAVSYDTSSYAAPASVSSYNVSNYAVPPAPHSRGTGDSTTAASQRLSSSSVSASEITNISNGLTNVRVSGSDAMLPSSYQLNENNVNRVADVQELKRTQISHVASSEQSLQAVDHIQTV
ncbi:Conserved oligomeric Golgi complex subunit 3 [Trinorchestia longiramus]|nr:Conserved oligomeric Golgi complex subunit 3 [Trinorchestia longiramus]